MITWTELQEKDVVMVHNGKRLGQVMDLEIDEDSGVIKQIVILNQTGKGALFQKPEELKIEWSQIVTIGADIILVNDEKVQKQLMEHKKRQNE